MEPVYKDHPLEGTILVFNCRVIYAEMSNLENKSVVAIHRELLAKDGLRHRFACSLIYLSLLYFPDVYAAYLLHVGKG